MKQIIVGVLVSVLIVLTLWPAAAQARSCHQHQEHTICLERVQRSAKYHWQYKVQATVDGQTRPLMQYDCQKRTQLSLAKSAKGTVPKPFTSQSTGDFICKLVDR